MKRYYFLFAFYLFLINNNYSQAINIFKGGNGDGFARGELNAELPLCDRNSGNNNVSFEKIFPNPARQFVEIVLTDTRVYLGLEIYNANATLIEIIPSEKLNGENVIIPLADMNTGVYFVKFIFCDGYNYLSFVKQ